MTPAFSTRNRFLCDSSNYTAVDHRPYGEFQKLSTKASSDCPMPLLWLDREPPAGVAERGMSSVVASASDHDQQWVGG